MVSSVSGSTVCSKSIIRKGQIGPRVLKPKSQALADRVRSGQWEYWNKGNDLWKATGTMFYEEMNATH